MPYFAARWKYWRMTAADLAKLTDQEKSIRILMAMGFEEVSPHPSPHTDHRLRHRVDGAWQWTLRPLESLDAMREARKDFTEDQWKEYVRNLLFVTHDQKHPDHIDVPKLLGSSAKEQADAFLLTI